MNDQTTTTASAATTASAVVDPPSGIATFLVILFALLKVTKVIDWDLVWVLSPWWIGRAISATVSLVKLVILPFAVIFVGIANLADKRADRKALRLRAERAAERAERKAAFTAERNRHIY